MDDHEDTWSVWKSELAQLGVTLDVHQQKRRFDVQQELTANSLKSTEVQVPSRHEQQERPSGDAD